MKDIKRLGILFSLIGALFKGFFSVLFSKRETGMTFRDAFATQTMRFFCRCPGMRDGGMITLGRESAKRPSVWKTPDGYLHKKFKIGSVPAELLTNSSSNSKKLILQLHGGAYMIGYMDTYRHLAERLSVLADGAAVLSIDYRIAPENVFPSALEDTALAWDWLTHNGYQAEDIIIVGDSAGGNLTIALTEKLRDEQKQLPRALICMSPWCDMSGEGASYTYNLYKDPMFGRKKGTDFGSYLDRPEFILAYAGNTDLHNKYLSPVYGAFHDFPPMLIQVGTYEVLESDSITVAEKARAAGVDVTLSRYSGMFHMFQLLQDLIPSSKHAWQEIGNFLRMHTAESASKLTQHSLRHD